MATADEYAAWIVKNADKKGTPDFDTVAAAYKAARSESVAPAPQAAESIGATIRDIPRQVGLTARYGMEALGNSVGVVTEPIRRIVTNPLLRAAGLPEGQSTGDFASSLADKIGLPAPRDANERVIGDVARTLGSAATLGGSAGKLAEGATGITKNVLAQMAARPGMQAAGAVGAGAAGGSVREAGGGPLEQFGASLLGGIGGGMAANKISSLASSATNAIKNAFTPASTQMQAVDHQIQLTLERSGVDWSQIPERIRQGLRGEVADALSTGGTLNADALRRLVVFQRAGVTPTIGQLTQDPGQITREMNLAKTGANSTDAGLQRLPALQNQNTANLLGQLDRAGAGNAPTPVDASRQAITSLRGNIASAEANIGGLYQGARDSSGRSVALDGATAMRQANERLTRDGVGKLPAEVDGWMNDIATGKTPLTVDYQQQLVKNLYRKMQGAGDNGDLRHGLRLVREAIDSAEPVGGVANPGNLPAVAGSVAPGAAAGDASILAFRTARTANRDFMQRVESNPALAAVRDGVEPDQFAQRFVISKSATAADVQALHGELDPASQVALRQMLVKHLKDAATGSTDDITKFSNTSFRKALRDIGDDKLGVFFDREEIQQFKDIGDAAKYMQAQPSGSAVNNSNSGALVIGRGLDMLDRIANYIPLGGRDIIKGKIQGMQQQQVLKPSNALAIAAGVKPSGVRMNPLLAAAVATPADARKNDRSD